MPPSRGHDSRNSGGRSKNGTSRRKLFLLRKRRKANRRMRMKGTRTRQATTTLWTRKKPPEMMIGMTKRKSATVKRMRSPLRAKRNPSLSLNDRPKKPKLEDRYRQRRVLSISRVVVYSVFTLILSKKNERKAL